MCLSPISILNKTKQYTVDGGQPVVLSVPCGKCAQCKKTNRLEWHFRTYHECKSVIDKGGYAYFDTLTYSDEHLPHFSDFVPTLPKDKDFSCFNTEHYRAFLKRLRRTLEYHYPDVHFTYFMTSEYGIDERYTHRPHYHIIFFISGTITPYDFSRCVSKSWIYGRTDGAPYQSNAYVLDHVISNESNDGNILKACNYVAKYVMKDSQFQSTLDKRIEYVTKHIDNLDPELIKRTISQFHRQSQGYGIAYLHTLDADERKFIFENGACRMVDSDFVKIVIRLPLYYERKLFYKCIKKADSLHWQPTYDGILYKQHSFTRNIRKLTEYYQNIIINAQPNEQQLINKYLGTRTLEDFSIYKLFYQGRLREVRSNNFDYLMSNVLRPLTDDEYNLYDWLHHICSSFYAHNLTDATETLVVDHDARTMSTFSTSLFNDTIFIPYNKQNLKKFTFNENTSPSFAHFDKLDNLFLSIVSPYNKQKQTTFDFFEELTKKFKILYAN